MLVTFGVAPPVLLVGTGERAGIYDRPWRGTRPRLRGCGRVDSQTGASGRADRRGT
jgi:hypothetical protein